MITAAFIKKTSTAFKWDYLLKEQWYLAINVKFMYVHHLTGLIKFFFACNKCYRKYANSHEWVSESTSQVLIEFRLFYVRFLLHGHALWLLKSKQLAEYYSNQNAMQTSSHKHTSHVTNSYYNWQKLLYTHKWQSLMCTLACYR